MQRKRYSAEFKREAVKLASGPGMSKRQVAQELGIHENLLRTWVRQFAAGKWEAAPGTDPAGIDAWREFVSEVVESVVVGPALKGRNTFDEGRFAIVARDD